MRRSPGSAAGDEAVSEPTASPLPPIRTLAEESARQVTTRPDAEPRIAVAAPESLTALHARQAPQKDHLCGAFWGSIALQAAGFTSIGDELVDQDMVARESRTTLNEGDPYPSLPPGVESRTDYRLELPHVDPARSGTAAPPLREAIARCSGGELTPLPIAGPWTARSVIELVRLAGRHDPRALLIANLRTGYLWGSKSSSKFLADYLADGRATGREPDWDVGHFVSIVCAIERGRRALIGILDTYPSLGRLGYYLQPAEAVAAGLDRDGSGAGGVLCVCGSRAAAGLASDLRQGGFDLRDWDNGSAS